MMVQGARVVRPAAPVHGAGQFGKDGDHVPVLHEHVCSTRAAPERRDSETQQPYGQYQASDSTVS